MLQATEKIFFSSAIARENLNFEPCSAYSDLHQKILSKEAKIGIIGLGYVGLPLAQVFNVGGYKVLGFEKSPEKVSLLNEGVSYIQDVPSNEISGFVKQGQLAATLDFSRLKDCDIVVICVPTPLAKTKDPDMSFIVAAMESVTANFRQGQMIILESTTYPGTTREILLPALQKTSESSEVGKDFFLAFSPERVDPGNKNFNTFNTPKVVGGISPACSELASLFYSQVIEKVVRVSSPESAEMVKLLENTFRAVNIGLVNEVALMCEKLGIDCWEVIEAASTKPFGYMPFYPGPGLGGHCIPIDPSYLSWKLRGLNYTARFIELANAVNTSMPRFCVDKAMLALNKDKKSINGARILVMGVAYKKDIDDMRESPALDLIHLLQNLGAEVSYYDPFVPEVNYDGLNLRSLNWKKDVAADFDLTIIATDHSQIDYQALVHSSQRVLDTRNATKGIFSEKVVKL